jgi:DNA-binding transcriptional regulator YdaS (Cro superfamily)
MDSGLVAAEPAFRAALREALEIAGTQAELERLSGIPQQTISWLLNKSEKISAEHAVAIERATGGRVPKSALRPDLFGPASQPSVEQRL